MRIQEKKPQVIRNLSDDSNEWELYSNKVVKNYVASGCGQSNVDIFICSHVMFKPMVSNPSYKVLFTRNGTYDGDELEGLKAYCYDGDKDDRYWSESCTFKWICDHADLSDYVGICHYRKYFSFMDNIPNMEEVFSDHDVVCGNPMRMRNGVLRQYSACHNVKDMKVLMEVLSDKYSDFGVQFYNFLNGKLLYPFQMSVMRREDFLDYANFIDSVLSDFLERIGGDIEARINADRNGYLGKYKNKSAGFAYQQRILGYLSERLTSGYIMCKFKKPYLVGVNITSKKY